MLLKLSIWLLRKEIHRYMFTLYVWFILYTFICKKAGIVCVFLSQHKCTILYKKSSWNIYIVLKTCSVCFTLGTSFIAYLLWTWFCFSLLVFLFSFGFVLVPYTILMFLMYLAMHVQTYLMLNNIYVMLCYVMLCYVMLCCYVVMLLCCYVMLCYVMFICYCLLVWCVFV